MKQKPIISVIVATKNEENNIGNCLESIKSQTYPPRKIEIIVVDNNSTDKTKEIAKKYTRFVFNYPQLNSKKKTKNFRGAQVNFGVKKSKGDIIFFPDADMTFSKGLLSEMAKKLDKYQALFIPETIKGRGLFGKIRNFERSFYNETCIDAIRATKKELYLDIGGFDETNIAFGPDDWDFTKTIRRKTSMIGITKSRVYHHEERMTIVKYVTKKDNYLQTFDDYIQKWGENDSDIKKQFSFKYRFFDVFLENGKWKNFLSNPFLLVGVYFLRFLVGIQYLKKKTQKLLK